MADKRGAILTGALTVFARDGYTRASIDVIAAEAGVSNRTIYNHFQDKADLFHAVIAHSAESAADARIAVIDRHFFKVTDVLADLVAFGRAYADLAGTQAAHFAIVRQIDAEAEHIPRDAVLAWQEAGPGRVLRELAARLAELAGRGLLRIADPDLAARHLLQLIATPGPAHPALAPTTEHTTELVTAGVRAFLYGYAGPAPTRLANSGGGSI
ncbi:TetR/AcrR family transcriptional regulator [Actinophytocola sediminis]